MDIVVGSSMSAMLDSLPPKLAKLLKKEYALLSRLREDEVPNIQEVIRKFNDCESLYGPDAQIRVWVNGLREIVYDVDDSIDLFAVRVHVTGGRSNSPCRRIFRWIHIAWRILSVRRIIASEIQKSLERIYQLAEERSRLRSPDFRCEPQPGLPPPQITGRLVGFDGPIEEVTKMVTSAGAGGKAEADLKIFSIVGMAGSGKTTLAAAVYRQLRQQNYSHLKAFVSLGQKVHMKKALNSMLSELDDGHQGGRFEDLTELMSRLKDILVNKRYVIVVDDLWIPEDWKIIRYCLPENSLGSRIITTTRNHELAMKCCSGSSDCIYNIGLLNEVNSKKLILDRAFGIGHGCPKHLEGVLDKIIRRCSGLPLALVTVPSMLEVKSSKDEWDRLVGSRWLSRPDAKVMMQILNLSYSDLPQDLKTCLLLLSIFPEDFKIDVDRLIRRWISEGYIPENTDPHFGVEEIAKRHIEVLISRNIVQRLPPVHGAPKYCRLHPVVHDFVVCKSMENNIVSLAVDDHNPPNSSNCTVYRRLSVQRSKHDQDLTSYDGMDLSHVRSITVFGQGSAAPRLTNLRVVRVLDFEGCVGPVCLDDLDKLPLLRYLSLKGTDVAELPAALWELRFLELLDVRSTKVKQLPASIIGLRNSLRTLLFGHEGTTNSVKTAIRIAEDIHDCHRLENVATVDLREHSASFVKALSDLNALRMLKITWSFHQCEGDYSEALLSSIEKWSKLRSLTIHCGLGCWMEFLDSLSHPPVLLEKFKVTEGVFVSVPQWIRTLRYLSFLQITICKIGTDDLNLLRDLPQLRCLILGLDFVPRNAIVIESDGFRELLRFSVDCPVPWLTFQTGAMPSLTHLQLEFCSGSSNPDSVPSGIGNLQRLKEVVLLYNQKWCADSSSVRLIVYVVRRQVAKHRNLIDLIINGTKADVQKVDEEMKSTTEIQSGDAGEEIARITVETTQGEIEIEGECDDISSTYKLSGFRRRTEDASVA